MGALIFSLSALLAWTRWESSQGWWMGLGGVVGMSFVLFVLPFWKAEEMEKLDGTSELDQLRQDLKTQESRASQELAKQRVTIETFQLKLQEAEEKIETYRKQGTMLHKEAERLKGELSQKKESLASLEKRLGDALLQKSDDPALAARMNELMKEKERLEGRLEEQSKPARKGFKKNRHLA